MEDGFAIVVVSLLFFVFGIVCCFHVGEDWGGRCEDARGYVLANLAAVLVGSLLFMIVWSTGYVVVGMFAFGAVAGAVAGLKFGYGESVGPWKFVERLMSRRGREADAARAQAKRARRRRERAGEPEPELISVQGGHGGHGGHGAAGKDAHGEKDA